MLIVIVGVLSLVSDQGVGLVDMDRGTVRENEMTCRFRRRYVAYALHIVQVTY